MMRHRVAFIGMALAATAGAEQPGEGVCEAQIRAIVDGRFGQTVESIEFRYRGISPADGGFFAFSQAIVHPNECPGYHFFELNADQYACEQQAHLGTVPNYAMYRSSGDGC